MKSHPALVSMQQDVIMDCLEDEDFSIRLQALELAAGMVTSDTLQSVVNRLIDQLRNGPLLSKDSPPGIVTTKDLGLSEKMGSRRLEELAASRDQRICHSLPLPDDYRTEVLHRVLDICSSNNYSELPDFEWYIDVLVQLVELLPRSTTQDYPLQSVTYREATNDLEEDVASRIGSEIRNVAVRVRSVRMEATRAAESLVLVGNRTILLSNTDNGVLGPLAWVIGEYAEFLAYPERTLRSLVDISNLSLPTRTLSLYLQAIPKVFIHLTRDTNSRGAFQKSESLLFLARIIEFLEALAAHPDLDVQERTVEFLEILRLAAEALHSETSLSQDVPLLLSSVMPSLFSGLELNPVAASAQRKVPLPERLILDRVLNDDLTGLFDDYHRWPHDLSDQKAFYEYYYSRDTSAVYRQFTGVAETDMKMNMSYQNIAAGSTDESIALAKRRAERKERNRDDPFYIGTEEESSGRSTPFHQVFNASNGDDLDVDSIPIIDLKIENEGEQNLGALVSPHSKKMAQLRPKKIDIAVDETIGCDDPLDGSMAFEDIDESGKVKPPLLQVDSSGLGRLSLDDEHERFALTSRDPIRGDEAEADMVRAMHEVEKVRLEMQRASERIHLQGTPAEGTPIKRRKKKDCRKRIVARSEGFSSVSQGSQRPRDSGTVAQKKKKKKTRKMVNAETQ